MEHTEKNSNPDDLIIAWLNGRLNQQEIATLEAWLEEDSSHKQYYYEMTEIWLATAAIGKEDEVHKQAAYNRIRKKLSFPSRRKQLLYRSRTCAAVVAMLLLTVTGFYLGRRSNGVATHLQLHEIEVPLGSRTKTKLPDGTVVWLNAGSKMTYSSGFSVKDREVSLTGEGYFEVTHQKDLPFIVVTQELAIRVLGTKFSVKAYLDQEEISVILDEGSVSLRNKNDPEQEILLKPQQQLVYNRENGYSHLKDVAPRMAGIWTNGAHFFDENTLEEITRQLEKNFDVRFIFRNEEKKELKFYGDFSKESTLADILSIMSATRKFTYKQQADIIEIY